MRIGVAGVGRIGRFHAETLRGLPAVESVIVADADPERARLTAAALSVETADSADALLAAGLDALVIAAATSAHPDLILRGLDAGLPVFCEKPVAKGAAEAAEVLKHTQGATVQIGYNRRFDPGFVAARAAVQSGELGWLHTIRSTTMDPAPPPRRSSTPACQNPVHAGRCGPARSCRRRRRWRWPSRSPSSRRQPGTRPAGR